ncbi:hypothetical protein CDAR_56091 [Caerostris darwini]|uniref:Uncharacterized protein n=1 Tax=Caerostris darwini TaxID=1538125 RepID=A0AAV4RS59_9ARAC|nr:hypothetical protein CDAR_56091 [Caerostris darwini]
MNSVQCISPLKVGWLISFYNLNSVRGIKLKTFVRSNASDRQGGNKLAIAFINNFHYLQTAPICIVANACAVHRYCGHSLNRCIVVPIHCEPRIQRQQCDRDNGTV